jgi:hypothetical protein
VAFVAGLIRPQAASVRLTQARRPMAVLDSTHDGAQDSARVSGDDGRLECPERVEGATTRLIAALDALEAVVERRQRRERTDHTLAMQLQALGADRSRLTAELDTEMARRRRLEAANRELAARLDAAIANIRGMLKPYAQPEPEVPARGKRRRPGRR